MNEKTYYELCELREKLKRTTRTESGRVATICTDRAIENISEYEPRTLEEMRMIDGVSKDFVDRHGQKFLDVVNKNRELTDRSVAGYQMTVRQSSIMKELEKNLVNINRRNKLLYTAKSQKKYSQDLFGTGYDVRDLIFGRRQSVTISSVNSDQDRQRSRYSDFSAVLKEAERDIREKGRDDLYIGYPFVKGRLLGEGFEVRAPLVLIPVKAEKTTTSIKLMPDEDRDALFNNILILAHHKHNGINRPLPDAEIEDYKESDYFQMLIDHYGEEGIAIKDPGEEFQRFTDYHSGEFPPYQPGELYLENVAALGKFTIQTSSIHKDYDEIIESNTVNELLYNLIDAEDMDLRADVFYGDCEIKERKEDEVQEKGIVYINDLNSSQERVLTTMERTNELVIQGPPGTGKSQTIASLIVDSVNKGKTVMMVSEKKTALDVVYSRLGNLSRYAIQIDDVGDKERFYEQMEELINCNPGMTADTDISAVSKKIDDEIKRLNNLADAVYTPDKFGISPYEQLHLCSRLDPRDDSHYQAYKAINGSEELLRMNYEDLSRSHDMFGNNGTVDKMFRYKSLVNDHPALSMFAKDLNDFDLRTMNDETVRISSDIEEWRNKFFLLRWLGKGSISKEIGGFIDRYLPSASKPSMVQDIIDNGFGPVTSSIGSYGDYISLDPTYSTLRPYERTYLDVMFSLRGACPDPYAINDEVFAQVLNMHIDDFRKNNPYALSTMDNFNEIIKRIDELTQEKKRLSILHTDYKLYASLYNNVIDPEKKGCKELRRKVESKRRKSVNQFVRSFSAQLFNGIKIWLMTPEVVSEIIPFEKGRFDLLIFDEASQMYREKGLPAYRAKKVVIAGDDKQLRPSSLGVGRFDSTPEDENEDVDAALEETSLLDLAKAKYTPVLLNYHYRSRYEELINFSNYAFYRGRLHVSPNVNEPDEPPIKMHIVDGLWADRCNFEEAKKVVSLIKEFFQRRKNNETLGIITFNISQRDLIEDMIDDECGRDPEFAVMIEDETNRKENGEDVGLFIRSIENVQGDERDEIIFSIAYARDTDGRFRRLFGSLSQEGGENRLNVAVTRAKRKVQIVTSMPPQEFDVSGVKSKGAYFLKKYLEYSYAVSEGNKDLAKSILLSFHDDLNPGTTVRFDSIFEEQVYDKLTDRGLSVDTQVGIGGYSIDLAIKKDGRYVLGIECDGKLYHNSQSARERDYHRQKYLESRGWRIHRIWSTNWWNDPDKEIDRIEKIVSVL